MAISRILSQHFSRKVLGMIIHLIRPARGTNARSRSRGTVVRRYPRIFIGPAALPLFCLAPHGVFRASRITPRAVSSYLAFSPLPASEREAVSFPYISKNRRYVFCDTFRQRPSRGCGTNLARIFYAACCRMVFGLSSSKSRQRGTHRRSSAIGKKYIIIRKAGKQERWRSRVETFSNSLISTSKWRWNADQKDRDHRQRDD